MGKPSHKVTRGGHDPFMQGTITMQVNKVVALMKTSSEQKYYYMVQPSKRENHRAVLDAG